MQNKPNIIDVINQLITTNSSLSNEYKVINERLLNIENNSKRSHWYKPENIIAFMSVLSTVIFGIFAYYSSKNQNDEQKAAKYKELRIQKLEIFNNVYPKLISSIKNEKWAALYVIDLLKEDEKTKIYSRNEDTIKNKQGIFIFNDSVATIENVAKRIWLLNADSNDIAFAKKVIKEQNLPIEVEVEKIKFIDDYKMKGKTPSTLPKTDSNDFDSDPSNRVEKFEIETKLGIPQKSIRNIEVLDLNKNSLNKKLDNLSTEFQFPQKFTGYYYKSFYEINNVIKSKIFSLNNNKEIIPENQ